MTANRQTHVPVAYEADDHALPGVPPAPGMAWIPGGTFTMGSDHHYPEEAPARRVVVSGFWMDRNPVTNAEFRRFVQATSYTTLAERTPDPGLYPDAPPALLLPGSLVFRKTRGPVPLTDFRQWWHYLPGADWKHPAGPESSISGKAQHPVVQIGHADAEAYAAWAGKELPTEAEWERAARGGLEGAVYAWGDEFAPGGKPMANTWQGRFPYENTREDGYEGTSPVGSFPANGYGLSDVAGNVWEWTADYWTATHADATPSPCCVPRDPRVPDAGGSHDAADGGRMPRRVIKGGSHLCAPSYCLRYRPAARSPQAIDSATNHLGFRCIVHVR